MSSQTLSTGITYQQVMQQPAYPKDPGLQAQVAMEYFNDRVKPQLDAKGVKDPATVEQARTEFFREYKIPEIKAAHPGGLSPRPSAPPVHGNFLSDFMATAINSGSAGALDLPHGQGVGSTLGSIAGPLVGTLGAAALAPESGGASLMLPAAYMGLVGAGNTAREQYNRTGGINNPLAVGVSGLTNAAFGALGPIARTASTPLRVAANAAFGGGQNALQDMIQQGAEQRSWTPNFDWERTKNAALMGAGLGAGFSVKGKKPARVEPPPSHEPLQGRVTNADEPPPPPPPQDPAARKASMRSLAERLHELMTSNDAAERVQGKEFHDALKAKASDKKYKSGRIKQPGDQQAREILAELSIIREQAKTKANIPKRDKSEIDRAVAMGKRARLPVEGGLSGKKSDGTLKAQFENYLKRRFNQEDQRIINARIGTSIKETKAESAAVSKKVKDRIEKRQTKREQDRIAAAKKAQDQKVAQIQAENDRLNAELKKQAVEKLHENMPRVLSPDQIELQAERLFQHYQKGEKGTLEAQISKYRAASKRDFTKSGIVDKSRSDAINETHARVLDRFNQKKSEAETVKAAKKPENVVKARAENLKALEDNQRAGGSHDFNTGKGKQRPLKAEALRWADVRDSITDPEIRAWGDAIDAAMKTDGVVRVRYDSERSGDTGEFEHKELSPIDWGFNFSRDEKGHVIDTRVVFHAVNKNGHTGEYYLQPSDPNPKTGTVSMVLEAPVRLPGKKAFRNTDPNVYKGPREFKISDIMARPPRRNQGLTSEGQAKLIEARAILEKYDAGESISAKDIKTVNRNAKKVRKDIREGVKALGQMSEKMKTVQVNIENEAVTAQDMNAMKQEIKETPNKKPVNEATNCLEKR